MNFLFLMDPLESVDAKKDTSFIFMVGAVRAGHVCWFVPRGGISPVGGRVEFLAQRVVPKMDMANPFERGEWTRLSVPCDSTLPQPLPSREGGNTVDAVFVRSEPPFDAAYLMDTWLLDRLPARIPVVNSPRGLRTVNEKVWASRFTQIVPATAITRRREVFESFLAEHGEMIAKPTDGYGGAGVFLVRKGDTNAGVIFETLTGGGSHEVVLQRRMAEADAGDKRVLLLGGEPLGAVLRVHKAGEHRNNFFSGGTAHPAKVDASDLKIIEVLKPHLLELGLHFVGIDVIGGKLIEVNVTSPTCVQEINKFDNVRLEDRVIRYVELLVEKRAVWNVQ